jgi:transcriptional regulator with GAF, ATPase, and Fis domain
MTENSNLHQQLAGLKSCLDQVNAEWSIDDHENLMIFFVQHLPQLMNAERSTIFISDPDSETAWAKFGTGIDEKQIEAPLDGSIVGQTINTGKVVINNDLDKQPGFHTVADSHTDFTTKSIISVPIKSLVRGEPIGAIQVLNKTGGFAEKDETFLKQIVKYIAFVIESSTLNQDIITLSKNIYADIETLEKGPLGDYRFIAKNREMKSLLDTVMEVGKYPINIFIYGESGTGKEIIARMIHGNSEYRDGPFIAVNCSSIPEHLMESEFFGHEKGAFTGATSTRKGRFEEATSGTLFLDEVADLPLALQPKFLRVIQENEGSRVGSNKIQQYNFRILSASSRDLRRESKRKLFREDLLFRLFSLELHIPPLRERRDDIIPLSMAFLDETCLRFNKKVAGFATETLQFFETFSWPGNVRQLKREVERLVALTPEGKYLNLENCSKDLHETIDQPPSLKPLDPDTLSLIAHKKNMEVRLINRALSQTKGNRPSAAKLLGITRQALHYKIKAHGKQII